MAITCVETNPHLIRQSLVFLVKEIAEVMPHEQFLARVLYFAKREMHLRKSMTKAQESHTMLWNY